MTARQTMMETLATRGDERVVLHTTRAGVMALAQILRLVTRTLIANPHRLHHINDLAERLEHAATSGEGQVTIEDSWPALIFETIDQATCPPSEERDIRMTIWDVRIENRTGSTISFSARTIVGLYHTAVRLGQTLPDGAIEWCSRSHVGETAIWRLSNRTVRIDVVDSEDV